MIPVHSVHLEHVQKAYREPSGLRTVLEDVDLELEAGSFVAITGPSGSGKSTLLNIIAAIEMADSGRVIVNGLDLSGIPEPKSTVFRRRHLGVVFQFFNLIPTLTVRENLEMPLKLCGVKEAGRVDNLLAQLALEHTAASFPDVLSGGEQQRVGVARAMVHRPSVILADEPTGNLDEISGVKVLDLLHEAVGEGTTVLMVTHSDRAADKADRRLFLQHGMVSE